MRKRMWLAVQIALALCARCGWCGWAVFEYPTAVLDAYDPDESCWMGIDALGRYPTRAYPERWLVGPPASAEMAVTIPTDHWLELGFSGGLVDGAANDIVLSETGKAGEQALLFVTDGGDQEYLLTKVAIEATMMQEISIVGADLAGVELPFAPRAIRLVALNMGGESPGFDLGYVHARVSHECGVKTCCPNPISGAEGLDPDVQLSWSPGSSAQRCVVYLSEVRARVEAGDAGVRYGPLPADANTFGPPDLQLGRTYYWRVDSLGPSDTNSLYAGDVWSFTVADHVAIDDFEAYSDPASLWRTWQPADNADLALEQEIVDTCQQSLVLGYYCDAVTDPSVSRSFGADQDWTRGGARTLQLLLHGDLPDSESCQFYVEVTDGANTQVLSDPVVAEIEDKPPWLAWRISLADLSQIDLTRVRGMVLGVRPAESMSPDADCWGTLNVAEIGLYGALCSESGRPRSDLTADCRVDFRDLERITADWLREPVQMLETKRPKKPLVWYEFDNNAKDRMGRADGVIEGQCSFEEGVYGEAIHFAGQGDVVTIPDAASVFGGIHDAITIAFWQKGDDSGHLNDTLFCSNYTHGRSNPAIAIHLGCWRDPGHYRWDCGSPWSFNNRLAGRHRDKSDWTGRWNHWAFTKDTRTIVGGRTGRMEIYLNGELYDRLTGSDTPITGITSFEIGSGWYGRYDGLIDDVQIYNYALSAAEVAYAATDGAGLFEKPASAADLNADGEVDFRDLATLAGEWLQDELWP
ncbi:MAG: LamG domain-containing protein [Phycisphaerales bacterium]